MGSLEEFASARGYSNLQKIAKGWTSEIFFAQTAAGKKVVLKVLREKSNRKSMVSRESENLRLANSIGVGPRLIFADENAGVVVMEFIEGELFSQWLFSDISKRKLEKFLKNIYVQAKALDELGLDHGQLAGRGRNILVRGGLPVIIDFEKASRARKVHNIAVLESFFYRSKGSEIVKRVGKILGS